MLGIEKIAAHLPAGRASNLDLREAFDVEESFLTEKIGVLERAIKAPDMDTSDVALTALQNLLEQHGLARDQIEALVVVTQNPDTNMPHVSALLQARADLPSACAAFDISLGCSGYVYGISVLQAFLAANGLSRGVLVTCDPYSKIIDPTDKSTVLLFGDAATATLIGPDPVLRCGPFTFGTQGDLGGALSCRDGVLHMNGREVFNFAATAVPRDIARLLDRAQLKKEDVDCFLFHQGSRYIVETLAKRIGLEKNKVRMDILRTGNTVSSSIPLLLQEEINNPMVRTLVLSGFGVGLSWSSCVCNKVGI
jgi:3-oxoacyl-[acyl-carrier-protein] synthase III